MKIRKVTRYEFSQGDEGDVTDIEFIPSGDGLYEVWVSGVFIEAMEKGARPSEVRAQYYFEVHGHGMAERVGAEPESATAEVAAAESGVRQFESASMH